MQIYVRTLICIVVLQSFLLSLFASYSFLDSGSFRLFHGIAAASLARHAAPGAQSENRRRHSTGRSGVTGPSGLATTGDNEDDDDDNREDDQRLEWIRSEV
jgi:hypothetical protein